MKTYLANSEEVKRNWLLINAENQILGRLAVVIANSLRGRNKVDYTPHVDTGDFVVVTNAEKVKLTGNKNRNKIYQNYSGFMGGLKTKTANEIRMKDPTRLIKDAVKGMLPNNRLARKQLKKLKIYAGNEHPHEAQDPVALKF